MKEFIKHFTDREIKNVAEINKKLFFISPGIDHVLHRIKKQPNYAGAYLGHIKGEKFVASFILLNMIAKSTDRITKINKKQEWNFTNKKDLNTKGATKIKEGQVIVVNQFNEVLGLGEIKGNTLKNILDVGDFLRRERK